MQSFIRKFLGSRQVSSSDEIFDLKSRIDYLTKDRDLLIQEMKDKEYFYELGLKAAKFALGGYVMVDKSFLPENKNCPLVMGHGYKIAEENIKNAEKTWGKTYIHDKEIFLNKKRCDLLSENSPVEAV